jgi:superfamily II DNA/RNA helicase
MHTLLWLPCRCGRAARAGRSGSALCLLTREELPFLLDLHLYLGRTVSRGLMGYGGCRVYSPLRLQD